MKAILLAAGRGTRISRIIKEIPKSTLPVDGTPLIRRSVTMLLDRNIKPIVCVGYCKEKIYEALEGLDVEYYYNPFYDVTNSIASLWFARKELTEDTIILNADVYFTNEILDTIISEKKDVSLMVDKSRTKIGDFFLKTENGYIIKYGKELPIEERSCEYVGIGKIRKSFIKEFKDKLNCLVSSQQHQLWWENILYSLIEDRAIDTIDVNGKFWSEIDYFDDYERILNYISKNDKKELYNIS
ncbi:NTP transferase domain-containing protein [Paeniclostridium hominis]|uniref:Phosphocholine cytidylyltransferase family protein n=1 Tax=Paeniclostridium hominis TaxID=2764329 RepID=A0ABR7K097_9FIRM|nr:MULTISPECIES: phosphocholine cytidylyltransferase family protein [Paeniclostridium]MBC6002517.1 phosphocholine cytidylyltransferase family protein [Paeniclostridium hominis]MBC8631674.1 phosphocholine cytidylyltransferase family protein [[Eubacterium] tenue]MDU1539540.1 phosphocholine cytidylyltransferase family protein [Paeniclostridium sordellii]